MTALVARLVLAMLILPVSGALFIIMMAGVVSASPNAPPNAPAILAMWLVLYSVIGAYWVALWRGVVQWTARRRSLTIVSAPAAIAVGGAAGAGFAAIIPAGAPLGIVLLFGGGVPPIVWVLATTLIWRETDQERRDRVALAGDAAVLCPLCGYRMNGLREATCPECGGRFTLDGLIRAQGVEAAADA